MMMNKKLLTLFIGIILIVVGVVFQHKQDAFGDTIGTVNQWTASSTISQLSPKNSNYGVTIATTSPLRLSALNCSGNTNGGSLTTDSSGNVQCSDDDGGGGGGLSGGTIGFGARWIAANNVGVGKLIDNGTVLGVNATSSTVTFNLQGNAGMTPFNVASSTGSSMFSVDQSGNITATGSLTLPSQINFNSAVFTQFQATTAGINLNFKTVAGAGDIIFTPNAVDTLWVNDNQSVGINTSTVTSTLLVQGIASHTNLLTVASSTGASLFTIGKNGSTTIASLGTGIVRSSSGSLFNGSIDISSDTNLAAGRSLTLSGDSVEADSELYTYTKSASLMAASGTISATTTAAQMYFPSAVTITRVACSTDVGTATIQLDERAEATPNTAGTDVMTAQLVCDNDSQTTTSFTNAGIATRVPLNIDIDSVASSPTRVRIHVEYTIDD